MSVQSINPQVMNPPQIQKKQRYPWHAVASFMLPGTGQFIKGDKKTGKRDLGIQIGVIVASFIGGMAMGISDIRKEPRNYFNNIKSSLDFKSFANQSATPPKGVRQGLVYSSVLIAALTAVTWVNRIQSSVNAYRKQPPVAVEKN